MHEPEPDAAPWNFFNLDNIFSNNYYGDSTQHDVKICHEKYITDNHYISVDNDENIARALLQEELSQLSIAESPELSHSGDECLQDSNVAPDWHNSSSNFYLEAAGQDGYLHESNDAGSLCSSPGDRSCDGDDYSYTLDITDESELDGEVEKRLYQMIPVPHVPRINGDIPSVDEATSDHQRLLDRLQLYDLIEHRVQGDGNCQFRALSDQFYRTPEHHKFVRQQVVHQLKAHPEMYEGYVPMGYADYLKRMAKSGEWGDHVTLQAAADSYGARIIVVTSFKDTCYIEILPKDQQSKRVIYLSFWAEVHYNSIYPRGATPPHLSFTSSSTVVRCSSNAVKGMWRYPFGINSNSSGGGGAHKSSLQLGAGRGKVDMLLPGTDATVSPTPKPTKSRDAGREPEEVEIASAGTVPVPVAAIIEGSAWRRSHSMVSPSER